VLQYFQFSVLSTFVQLDFISKSGCISTFKLNLVSIFHFLCVISPKCKFDSTGFIFHICITNFGFTKFCDYSSDFNFINDFCLNIFSASHLFCFFACNHTKIIISVSDKYDLYDFYFIFFQNNIQFLYRFHNSLRIYSYCLCKLLLCNRIFGFFAY